MTPNFWTVVYIYIYIYMPRFVSATRAEVCALVVSDLYVEGPWKKRRLVWILHGAVNSSLAWRVSISVLFLKPFRKCMFLNPVTRVTGAGRHRATPPPAPRESLCCCQLPVDSKLLPVLSSALYLSFFLQKTATFFGILPWLRIDKQIVYYENMDFSPHRWRFW